jgi:hypothetical protein
MMNNRIEAYDACKWKPDEEHHFENFACGVEQQGTQVKGVKQSYCKPNTGKDDKWMQ